MFVDNYDISWLQVNHFDPASCNSVIYITYMYIYTCMHTCTCTYYIHTAYKCVHQSFDKPNYWPKELLTWHYTVLSLGQMAQLIYIVNLSLTASILYQLAQDEFPMAHTLTVVEPIQPMLQNISKTLAYSLTQ